MCLLAWQKSTKSSPIEIFGLFIAIISVTIIVLLYFRTSDCMLTLDFLLVCRAHLFFFFFFVPLLPFVRAFARLAYA